MGIGAKAINLREGDALIQVRRLHLTTNSSWLGLVGRTCGCGSGCEANGSKASGVIGLRLSGDYIVGADSTYSGRLVLVSLMGYGKMTPGSASEEGVRSGT